MNVTNKMLAKHIMTRTEAIALFKEHIPFAGLMPERVIDFYVAAGMLEIKEEQLKEVIRLCSYERNDLGLLKIEEWPEGIVVWIGGKIKYKSWEDNTKLLLKLS